METEPRRCVAPGCGRQAKRGRMTCPDPAGTVLGRGATAATAGLAEVARCAERSAETGERRRVEGMEGEERRAAAVRAALGRAGETVRLAVGVSRAVGAITRLARVRASVAPPQDDLTEAVTRILMELEE